MKRQPSPWARLGRHRDGSADRACMGNRHDVAAAMSFKKLFYGVSNTGRNIRETLTIGRTIVYSIGPVGRLFLLWDIVPALPFPIAKKLFPEGVVMMDVDPD